MKLKQITISFDIDTTESDYTDWAIRNNIKRGLSFFEPKDLAIAISTVTQVQAKPMAGNFRIAEGSTDWAPQPKEEAPE